MDKSRLAAERELRQGGGVKKGGGGAGGPTKRKSQEAEVVSPLSLDAERIPPASPRFAAAASHKERSASPNRDTVKGLCHDRSAHSPRCAFRTS